MYKVKISEIIIIQMFLLFINLFIILNNKIVYFLNFEFNSQNIFYILFIILIYYFILANFKYKFNLSGLQVKREGVNIQDIEIQIIIIINFLASILIILVNHLLSFFLLLELFSISIYLYLYFFRNLQIQFFAISYFIISTISSLFFLFSI